MRPRFVRTLMVLTLAMPLALPALANAQAARQAASPAAPLPHQSIGMKPAGATAASPLQRLVTLDVANIALGEVLAEISAQTTLGLVYASDLIPLDRKISVHLDATPAAVALRRVLADTDVDFTLASDKQVILVKRPPAEPKAAPRAPATGTLVGRVTDADTGEGVAAADVWLDGTSHRMVTNSEGRFLFNEVPTGTYNLRVRRIGYAATSRSVTIAASQTVTANFALQSAPTQLDAIVATVTGEQRIRELGHVIGRIDAEAVVREAPVSSISELLNGRVPGLQVFQTSGTVGGEVNLRVRSANSVLLGNEPIVIVDGIRYTSGAQSGQVTNYNVEPTSRLNDLNPNDIESVEVVKGPSAATLYGTDAANGVIVIRTKRGRPGPARWNAYARAGVVQIPDIKHPDIYWGWPKAGTASCTLRNQALGSCVQDSVGVVHNPLNDPDLTIFGEKPQWQYGLNVSGGREDIRYYFSADLDRAAGPLRLPGPMVARLKEQLGNAKIPTSQLEPNRQERMSLRSNVVANLGAKGLVRVDASYTQNETRNISLSNPFNRVIEGMRPGDEPYGSQDPTRAFSMSSTEWVNRFTGSIRGEYQFLPSLTSFALIGVDLPGSHRYTLVPSTPGQANSGYVDESRVRHQVTTMELGATASGRLDRFSSRTSIGAQYVKNYRNELRSWGNGLRPGGSSIIDAATKSNGQSYNETITLGSYIEQVFGLNDRLFLTGAVRADGASTFGNAYKAAFYPKMGASWVLSEEPFVPQLPGLDEFRVRYAYGASGQQPTPGMRRLAFQQFDVLADGKNTVSVMIIRLPSPDLRPEKVKEHEFGLDASALAGRAQLGLTWNRRKTIDQITTMSLPSGLRTTYGNLGLVSGRGFEAQLNAQVLTGPTASLNLTLTHATNESTLEKIGGQAVVYSPTTSLVEGFPLGARFMRPLLSYEDKNGDGIIDHTEVVMGDTAVYMGKGTPGQSQTLGAQLGLLNHKLRFSMLLERRGDFVLLDEMRQRNLSKSRAGVDPTAPLEEQAKAMAYYLGGAPGQFQTAYTFVEPGDFTRLREATIAFDLPQRWLGLAGVDRATMSISGRNLALWTKFDGVDPESARLRNYQGGTVDNLPQARTWTFRVDLGF